MKPGRKSKYETNVLPDIDRVSKLARQGYHDYQIAKVLGVGTSTFKEYISKYPALRDALKKGKETLVEDLEDTLYRKALGKCTIKEVKKYIQKDKTGKETTRIEEIVKEIPPDTGCLIFSLKNLAPDRWKDSHEATFKGLDEAMDNFKLVSSELEKNLTEDVIENDKDE